MRDAAGQIVKWYGTAMDINETKSLEQQARSFANRLITTLESITDGFFILDKNWTYTFLNTQAERMLGRTRQKLLGKTLWLEFPPAAGTVSEQQYYKAVKEGVPVHFQDYYLPPLDRWYAVSAYTSDEGLAVYFRVVTQTQKDLAQLQLLKTAVPRLNDIVLITEAEPFDEPGSESSLSTRPSSGALATHRQRCWGKRRDSCKAPKPIGLNWTASDVRSGRGSRCGQN